MSKFSNLLSATVVAAIVGLGGSAQATPIISVAFNETGVTPVAPSNCAPSIPCTTNTGVLVGVGSVGSFGSITVSATGSPALTSPQLDTQTIDISTLGVNANAGETLYIWFTVQGLDSPLGVQNFQSSFTTNQLHNIASVTETTFIDPANGLFTGTQLATKTFTASNQTFFSINATPFLNNPFSETTLYVITVAATGNADANSTIDIDLGPQVPEPLTLSLFGAGLAGLAGLRRRKAKA
jgi:hypothetical protein